MRSPNLFIVGAPKSGTTALHEYLKAHPDVFMTAYKEPHYFGSDLQGPRMAQFRGNKKKYLSLFAGARDEKWVGESSIWYLYSSHAAREIHAYDPSAAIIIMLRNPLEMGYSMYYQSRYTGNEILPTFEQALDAESERHAGRAMPPLSHTHHGLFYTALGHYTDQVQRYFEMFGRERVHVIIYDDFKADTAGEYRRTLSYLEVDPTFTTTFNIINANKRVRLSGLQKTMLALGISPMLLKDQLNYIAATSPLLPQAVRSRLLDPATSTYTRYERRPSMQPETQARLEKLFLPEMERLSALLGRDMTHWCGIPQRQANA